MQNHPRRGRYTKTGTTLPILLLAIALFSGCLADGGTSTPPGDFALKASEKAALTGQTIEFRAPTGAKKYRWSFGDGATEVTDVPKTTHAFDGPGTYTVEVRALYADVAIREANVTVEVPNTPPTPEMEVPDTIEEGEDFDLRSDSSDREGEIARTVWRVQGAERSRIYNGTQVKLRAPFVEENGTLNIELIVVDSHGADSREKATLTVEQVNSPPTLKELASVDRTEVSQTVQVRGTDEVQLKMLKPSWRISVLASDPDPDPDDNEVRVDVQLLSENGGERIDGFSGRLRGEGWVNGSLDAPKSQMQLDPLPPQLYAIWPLNEFLPLYTVEVSIEDCRGAAVTRSWKVTPAP